jgi:hypothetical protein
VWAAAASCPGTLDLDLDLVLIPLPLLQEIRGRLCFSDFMAWQGGGDWRYKQVFGIANSSIS